MKSPIGQSGRYNPLEEQKGQDFPDDGGEVAMWPSGGKPTQISKQKGGKQAESSGASASPPLSGSIPHRHTHRRTQRACLLSRRGSAPALNSTKVQGELKQGREASKRQAGGLRLLPGVVGGVVRARGQAALAPFRIHSALRWYIPALWGEERQWSSTAAAAPDSGAGSRGREGGRDGGGVDKRRRGERGSAHTHTRLERDSASTSFSRSLPSVGRPSLLRALPVFIHAASGALSLSLPL